MLFPCSTCNSLSKFCPKLKHLDLASCTSITNLSLKALRCVNPLECTCINSIPICCYTEATFCLHPPAVRVVPSWSSSTSPGATRSPRTASRPWCAPALDSKVFSSRDARRYHPFGVIQCRTQSLLRAADVVQQMQQHCSVIFTLQDEMTTRFLPPSPQQKSQIINFSSLDVTSFNFIVPCFALNAQVADSLSTDS